MGLKNDRNVLAVVPVSGGGGGAGALQAPPDHQQHHDNAASKPHGPSPIAQRLGEICDKDRRGALGGVAVGGREPDDPMFQ
ncbi:hypothetical protein As57867_007230, partial [Aphanomyces stellatus]